MHSPHLVIAITCAAAMLGGACRRQAPERSAAISPDTNRALRVEPLGTPAPAGSRTPQLTGSNRGTLLSWIAQDANGRTALRFAERVDGHWSAPVDVASGTDWFVSWADVPTVQRLAGGALVANWYRSTDVRLEAYDLWMSHSEDDGRTWAHPFTPHHDGTRTQHGFASLVELPSGLGVVWLDAREWQLAEDDPEGGSVMLRYASFDRTWTQTADQAVNPRVCECCQTSAVLTPDGVAAAFRDRSDAEVRDINVTRLDGGAWSAPQAVHRDEWHVETCPVNGPAIAGHGRLLVTAWFTAIGDEGHAYAAFSPDAGHTWGTPVRLDDKRSLGHVDVDVLADGSAVASWVEFSDQRARLRVRRVDAAGHRSAAVEVAGSGAGRVSGYPRLVRDGQDLVLAWTESTAGDGAGDAAQQVKVALIRPVR